MPVYAINSHPCSKEEYERVVAEEKAEIEADRVMFDKILEHMGVRRLWLSHTGDDYVSFIAGYASAVLREKTNVPMHPEYLRNRARSYLRHRYEAENPT